MITGYDSETYLIAPGRLAPPLVCASWARLSNPVAGDPGPVPWSVTDRAESHPRLRDCLANGETLVGHNMAFDMGVAASQWPDLLKPIWSAYEAGKIRCTMIREALGKIAKGELQHDAENGGRPADLSLSGCARARLNVSVEGKAGPDIWRLKYYDLRDTPIHEWPPEAKRYAGKDAELAVRVFCAQALHHPMAEAYPDELNQTRYHFALHVMSCWGLRADGERVRTLRGSLESRISLAKTSLIKAGLLKADGSKTMAIIRARVEAAYPEGELPRTAASSRFPDGQVQTSAEVLRTSGDPDLELLASISEDEGELSKYVEALEVGAVLPINARVTPLVATGRTSMSKPPLQQLPRRPGVRECIVPREGMLFVGADYSTQELVTLAQVCLWRFGFSALAEALQAGRDPHLVTGAAILGIEYEDATQRKKDPVVKDARQIAKCLNFGLPGGLGAERFCDYAKASYNVKLTPEEARELKSRWLSWYPEMRMHFEWTASRCEAGGGAFDLDQPGSGRVRGAVRFTDGCNSVFQGLAADMSKRAVWYVTRECLFGPGPLWGARVVLLMHDEIILEVPESQASAAGDQLRDLMVLAGTDTCPDIPIKAEPWICDHWTKAAETRRDAEGRLVAWEAA